MEGDLTREEVGELKQLSDDPDLDDSQEPREGGGAPPHDVALPATIIFLRVLEWVDPILSRIPRRSPGLSSGASLTELILARESLLSYPDDRQRR